jgi:hypothetical protein
MEKTIETLEQFWAEAERLDPDSWDKSRAAQSEQKALRKDAERWRFLTEHWHSLMASTPLHRWIEEQALRRGGVTAALDYAMEYHANGERHIA